MSFLLLMPISFLWDNWVPRIPIIKSFSHKLSLINSSVKSTGPCETPTTLQRPECQGFRWPIGLVLVSCRLRCYIVYLYAPALRLE